MRVQVKGLHKSYWMDRVEVPVLNGVDLLIEPGELVSITGASGVGKSTFLHVLGTLDIPSRGTVLYDGEDIFGQSPAAISAFRNRNIGFVFQFHHLLPEFTALENVMMPARVARLPDRRARDDARAILDLVGLTHRVTHRPGELSGGEQQRVALARALVLRPRLLLADEPTGNLDEHTGGAIHDLLFRLNEEMHVTAIVVTHNTSLAARLPRRLSMHGGLVDTDSAGPLGREVPPPP
ncbi:MAG: ABC transporter ATP-binding protein [Deltaproteobacteria bacterium]|nr:ABC transporter ATP-binding protein [Deltaproteobacteria bacterium]